MTRFRRQRDRAWVGLGVLLGLLVGGLPAGEDCPMGALAASTSHAEVDHRPDSGPAGRRCCHPTESTPAASRAIPPAPGTHGSDSPCRARTSSCCCASGVTQAVAERSARPRASQADARGFEIGPVASIARGIRPLLLADASGRPGPSKVPLYLRTGRLRN